MPLSLALCFLGAVMPAGLNHITIAVSDIDCSMRFYTELLGFTGHVKWDHGAYLSLGGLWFCLSLDKPDSSSDYTHIAFDVSHHELDDMRAKLNSAQVQQWKQNSSEGDSLYLLDPDGHKLELHVGSLRSRLESLKQQPYQGLVWLDSTQT